MSPEQWEIGTLDINPGQILLIRWTRPQVLSASGMIPLTGSEVEKVLQAGRNTMRQALDDVGLTHDKVPILAITDDWDLTVINPLELMDVCATAEKNKKEETEDE